MPDVLFQSSAEGLRGLDIDHSTSRDATHRTGWPLVPGFRLVKEIDNGGSGTVYVAEDTIMRVFCAVKVMRPGTGAGRQEAPDLPSRELTTDSQRLGLELAGIRAVKSRLAQHPHVIQILNVGTCTTPADGSPSADSAATGDAESVFYAMELADDARRSTSRHPGDYEPLTLQTLLQWRGRLSVDQALGYAGDLLGAIEHLRAAGLHHRDIKPANVVFVDGTLKLADLGLLSPHNEQRLGTPGFVPPDSPPDDVYALGKTFYEMVTGLPARRFPDWPAELRVSLDPRLKAIRGLLADLCDPSAARRAASAQGLRNRITTLRNPRPVFHLSVRWMGTLGVLLLLAGMGLGGAMMWRASRVMPPHQLHATAADYNGAVVEQAIVHGGFRWMLSRRHVPDQLVSITENNTTVRLRNIQTALSNGKFAVYADFQLENLNNALTSDMNASNGYLNALYLDVGETRTLLYFGQQMPEGGVTSVFGRAVALDQIAEGQSEPSLTLPVFLILEYGLANAPITGKSQRDQQGMISAVSIGMLYREVVPSAATQRSGAPPP